jgi:hypothetical protein
MTVSAMFVRDGLHCRRLPFTDRQRRRLARQTGYGHRPVNEWGSGDLPAPYAEGDMLYLPVDATFERLHDMGPGYFVVTCAFSIDDGDAWYFRVSNDVKQYRSSDRLHVAFAERSTWDHDCDYMAPFELVDTADPDGLELRERMLKNEWKPTLSRNCPTCGTWLPPERTALTSRSADGSDR